MLSELKWVIDDQSDVLLLTNHLTANSFNLHVRSWCSLQFISELLGLTEPALSLQSVDQMTAKQEILCQEIWAWVSVMSLCCSVKLLTLMFFFFFSPPLPSLRSPVHQHPEEESVAKNILCFYFFLVFDVSVDICPMFFFFFFWLCKAWSHGRMFCFL